MINAIFTAVYQRVSRDAAVEYIFQRSQTLYDCHHFISSVPPPLNVVHDFCVLGLRARQKLRPTAGSSSRMHTKFRGSDHRSELYRDKYVAQERAKEKDSTGAWLNRIGARVNKNAEQLGLLAHRLSHVEQEVKAANTILLSMDQHTLST